MVTFLETSPMAENNMRELYKIYLELGHEVFEEKIKKPMKIYLHDGSNVITINFLNTIIANDMDEFKLGEVGFYENDIFNSPSFEEKIFFDDTLPPIYDDYNDSGILVPPTMEDKVYYDYTMPAIYDDYNDGCDSFTPTITNKIDYAYVESNDTFMHVNKNALCDSYIVEFVHDAIGNYYERGKYGCRDFHVTKTPLFLLKILKLRLSCFPMLIALCLHDLFIYKIPFHRKWVRLKSVSYLLLMLSFASTLISCESIIKITEPILMAIKKALLGR